jgi:hypothetical protein
MRIRAALVGPSCAWEQILIQEGFPYSVADLSRESLVDEYSVAIVHRPLSSLEKEAIEAYLRSGGALLGDARHCAGIGGTAIREEPLEYLVGEGNNPFRSLLLIDLVLPGAIPVEATHLRYQQNSFGAFAGSLAGGWAVLIPFSADTAVSDTRVGDKTFYARYERLPSERVSIIAKGEIRHLVSEALEFLHVARGLPYAHLWYFPDNATNVFAFRVDSDGAPKSDIETLYAVAHERGIGLTWFLDVKSHEPWLPYFVAMVGQEIGVHCYEHRVDDSTGANYMNFAKAKKILEAVGLRPEGFAAPFGIWTPGLAAVTRELGFRYSSEFSYAYDSFPLQPATTAEVFGVLQVPIHPICVGSLRQVGYTPRQMQAYFTMAAEWKMRRRDPLFFYHHPSHQGWDTVKSIFGWAGKTGVRPMTFGSYARWWEERGRVRPEIHSDGNWVRTDATTTVQAEEARVWLRIVRKGGKEAIMPLSQRLELDMATWSDPPAFQVPDDIRRVREFDPRRVLGRLFDSMIRRMR